MEENNCLRVFLFVFGGGCSFFKASINIPDCPRFLVNQVERPIPYPELVSMSGGL